nr:hypothetical protein [Lachnospiraceae bacterium]
MSIYHQNDNNLKYTAGWTCKYARPVLHIKAAALAMSAVLFLTSCGNAPVSQADPAADTPADTPVADESADETAETETADAETTEAETTETETADAETTEAETAVPERADPDPGNAVVSEVYVERIPGLPEDFIDGMDISSVIAEEK